MWSSEPELTDKLAETIRSLWSSPRVTDERVRVTLGPILHNRRWEDLYAAVCELRRMDPDATAPDWTRLRSMIVGSGGDKADEFASMLRQVRKALAQGDKRPPDSITDADAWAYHLWTLTAPCTHLTIRDDRGLLPRRDDPDGKRRAAADLIRQRERDFWTTYLAGERLPIPAFLER